MEQTKPLKDGGFFRPPENIPDLKGIKEHGGDLYQYIEYLLDQRLLLAVTAIHRGYDAKSWRWFSVAAFSLGLSFGTSIANWAHEYDVKHPVQQEAK